MSDQTEERSLLEEAAYNYMNRSVGNGTIVRIVGPVVDVQFDGQVPAIYTALTVDADTPVGKVFLVEGEDGSDYGDSDCIYIQWIAMDDGYQGKGYIKGAIQALEKEFPHKKYITAECGDDLLPMYQHLGFEFTGKNPYTFDEMNRIRKAIGKGND